MQDWLHAVPHESFSSITLLPVKAPSHLSVFSLRRPSVFENQMRWLGAQERWSDGGLAQEALGLRSTDAQIFNARLFSANARLFSADMLKIFTVRPALFHETALNATLAVWKRYLYARRALVWRWMSYFVYIQQIIFWNITAIWMNMIIIMITMLEKAFFSQTECTNHIFKENYNKYIKSINE